MSNCIAFTMTDVWRKYPGDPIGFPGVIEIPRGGMVGVLGRSGSGKTTLLNLLALMDKSDEGSIAYYPLDNKDEPIIYQEIDGNVEDMARIRAQRFGYIFQNDELLDHFSVGHNIQMRYWRSGKQLSEESLKGLLKQLSLDDVDDCENRNPADLSVGQRSRVGILRAYSSSPEVIFADEPTANVDGDAESEIFALLHRWCHDKDHPGRTVILSTHRIDIASRYCDNFLIIKNNVSEKKKEREREDSPLEVIPLTGRQEVEKLRDVVLGATQDKDVVLPSVDPQPHSKLRAFWKFLFYDFWRYRRSEKNFLVARVTPLLFLMALFLLVCCGSFILGIREGSGMRYQEEMQNDLLWNTEISATQEQIKQLIKKTQGEKLLKFYHGFFRLPVLVYRNRTPNYSDLDYSEQLAGRTMENGDPLLKRIGETLIWPQGLDKRKDAIARFQNAEFGVIISADALEEALGYSGDHWPDAVAVWFDKYTQVWVPVFGVAREIPSGDFIINTNVYAAYTDIGFAKRYLEPKRFLLGLEANVSEEEAKLRLEAWLAKIGIDFKSVKIRTIKGERVFRVNLLRAEAEFGLRTRMRTEWDEVDDIVKDIRFPKSFRDTPQEEYIRWSVILQQDPAAIRQLIRACYSHKIVIDTSVQARVNSLKKSYSIFRVLSSILFWTTLGLASVLLFTTTWFDSNRKIHAVGVMLGLGVSRRLLISAYAAQLYLLMGLLLLTYAGLDMVGGLEWLTRHINASLLGKEDLIAYTGWSGYWWWYTGVVLLGIPVAIAGLRFLLYRNQPASLINFRD